MADLRASIGTSTLCRPSSISGESWDGEVLSRAEKRSPGAGDEKAQPLSSWRRTVLRNGLIVVTDSMPAVRSLSMAVVVEAGPGHDPEGKSGLAHLVEHLMFQGTRGRDALAIARLMDDAGGQIGAFTSRDYTCFYATALDDYRTYALELLGDILLNAVFPQGALERQQRAIVCEIEGRWDSAECRADARVKRLAWPQHPLGRSIPGIPSTVLSICRHDVVEFVGRHYRPEQMVVAAAGRLDHDDFVAQVTDSFWSLGSVGEGRPPASLPDQAGISREGSVCHHRGVALEHLPVSQASFVFGIPAGRYTDSQRYALFVLDRILGGGLSSRLFRRLREEEGLVYEVGTEIQCYRRAGLWLIRGSTRPQNLTEVLRSVLVALKALLTGSKPADEEELERARRQLTAQHLLGSEDPQIRMSRLITQELYFGRHLPSDEIIAGIENVGRATLDRRSRALWEDARAGLCLAVLAPECPEYYSAEMLQEIQRGFHED